MWDNLWLTSVHFAFRRNLIYFKAPLCLGIVKGPGSLGQYSWKVHPVGHHLTPLPPSPISLYLWMLQNYLPCVTIKWKRIPFYVIYSSTISDCHGDASYRDIVGECMWATETYAAFISAVWTCVMVHLLLQLTYASLSSHYLPSFQTIITFTALISPVHLVRPLLFETIYL